MAAAAAGALLSAGTACAQTAMGGRAGTLQDDERTELRPLSEPQVRDGADGDDALPDPGDAVSFDLHDIRFDPVTVVAPAELTALSANLVGKSATLSDMRRLARRITGLYAAKGYGFSFAYVPEQRVADGVVRIAIVEARLGQVEVRIDGRGALVRQDAIRRLVETRLRRLREPGPLSTRLLERTMLLLNDLGGLSASVTVVPASATDSASDLIVAISADPASVRVGFDNRLRPEFGRYTASLGVTLNSLLLAGDSLAASSRTGIDHTALQSVALSYSIPLGGHGVVATLGASRARTHARSGLLAALDFQGRESGLSAGVSYPLMRSRSRNLLLDASFEAIDSRSQLLGSVQVSDRIRTFSVGASYDWADAKGGRSIVHLGLAKGVAGLGATPWFNPLASRIFAAPASATVSARIFTERPLNEFVFRFELEGEATVAGAKLAPVECAYGGQRGGQAYFPGAIGGDHCLLGSVEASRTFAMNGGGRLTPYLFADFGLLRQRGALDLGERRHEEAASLGIGLRGALPGNLTLSASLAKPLATSANNPARALRLFAAIATTL